MVIGLAFLIYHSLQILKFTQKRKNTMRNRAKCRLCDDIIESMHPSDLQLCKCGEIGVDGGEALKCSARDWANFLRVDDEGKETAVRVQLNPISNNERVLGSLGDVMVNAAMDALSGKGVSPQSNILVLGSLALAEKRRLVLEAVNEMISTYEKLPPAAMSSPVTYYDLLSVLLLLESLARNIDGMDARSS
jgi:hypothetical protein